STASQSDGNLSSACPRTTQCIIERQYSRCDHKQFDSRQYRPVAPRYAFGNVDPQRSLERWASARSWIVDTWSAMPVRFGSTQMNGSSIGRDTAVVDDLSDRHATLNFEASSGCLETTQLRPISRAEAFPARRIKVLFANKFFFLNGGSEAVMFDEMQL